MSAPATTRRGCTCHSTREFSGGRFGSLADLGVLCGNCEALMADAEEEDRREALTPAERSREDVAGRWATAQWRLRGMYRRPGFPEASYLPF